MTTLKDVYIKKDNLWGLWSCPNRGQKSDGGLCTSRREGRCGGIKGNTPGEKLDLKFTPPIIAISNSISIYIHKHTR